MRIQEIASSEGLSKFGRGIDPLSILTPEEISAREEKRLAIISRHRTPLARQVEALSRENVFAACVIVVYRAIEAMFGREAADSVIADCGYRREDLLNPEFRIRLEIFNRIMAKARQINQQDPGSDFTIGRFVNEVRWGNVERMAGYLTSALIPVMIAFSMIPKGNAGFNITKDFIVRKLEKAQAIIDMVIFKGIDPVLDDIFSRFFIMGIFSVIPHLWDMPDAQIEEIVLQYDVLDTLIHFRNESNRLGWGLKINNPHMNGFGQLVINNDIYGKKLSEIKKDTNEWQRIGMEISRYGIDIERLISNSPEAVYIYKDLLLRDGPVTGEKRALYLLRKGQIYNATFSRYLATWKNPSFFKRFSLKNLINLWMGSGRELRTLLRKIWRSEQEKLVIAEGDQLSQLRSKNIEEIEARISKLKTAGIGERATRAQAGEWAQEFEQIGGATREHVQNVRENSCRLARWLGLHPDRIKLLEFCAEVHDLGKALVPRELLEKKDKPTEREFLILQSHAEATGLILREMGFVSEEEILIAQSHHEKLDGSGYPKGLKGEEIPLESRIISIVDIFDARTDPNRLYRKPDTWLEVSLSFEKDVQKNLFDKEVVKTFLAMIVTDGYRYGEEMRFCPLDQKRGIEEIIERLKTSR